MKLYARNMRGGIKEWSISPLEDTTSEAVIKTGLLNGNLISTIISHNDIKKEIASRIAKKRKEGYVSLKDLGWIEPGTNVENSFCSKQSWLQEHLPKYNTDANNNLKPMKCQKFKEGVITYPALAQPKLNGMRCVLRWEEWKEGEGMFATTMYGAKLRSKEGHEYYMPHITNYLNKEIFFTTSNNGPIDDLELVYDGELYCHNMPLNQIKASCPSYNSRGTLSRPSGNPKAISFHSFDLAIPDYDQEVRLDLLDIHCPNTDGIKYVPYIWVHTDEEVLAFRDKCISEGYEGCVVREATAEYAFGSRPSFIRKCKTHMDSEFLIVALIPKPSDASLPLFILKNDINEETFECNPSGSWDYQRDLFANESNLIGKYATVRYRERTGTDKKLPFHANVIDIRDKKE